MKTSFEALSEIAETINTIQETEPLLEKILTIALETLSAERGFILLKSKGNPGDFEIRSSRNFTQTQLQDIQQISTSVVKSVFEESEPVLLFDAQKDPRYSDSKSIVLQKIQSIACVPLTIKNRQLGAIYLDSVINRSRFTEESLPFLHAFANQAAIAIENARLYESLREENRLLRKQVEHLHGFDEIVGQHPRMKDVFDMMSRVLESDASVLIEGESGTGKELVARAIHYRGHRSKKPFMAFFCGSLPDSLLESELFGHKKGAFTGAVSDKRGLFEAAEGGTFFLDEIGDLSLVIQSKLLRVLQEGEIKRVGENQIRKVDVRIISATNKTLSEQIKKGEFREDLYYRLNTICITMPPLRERRSDIPLLAHHFLDTLDNSRKETIKGFDDSALNAMEHYSWPGNVRELRNIIERSILLARGEWISAQDLRLPESSDQEWDDSGSLTLKEVEKNLVRRVLSEQNGNVSETARILDVSRRWLHYKIKEWQI